MEEKVKPKYNLYMINSDIEQRMRDGEASIDFEPELNVPLAHRMLTFPWRGFAIKVKNQLKVAIKNSTTLLELAPVLLKSVRKLKVRFGDASKQNTLRPIANCLLEHKVRFLSYECLHEKQNALFEAAFSIMIMETETDLYYEDRLNVELEWIIEDILAGKWEPRCEGQPHQHWNEPAPFGGKYSIVYKLQKHREEILKIIGDE